MANPNKVHTSNINKQNLSLFTFTLLVISFIGTIFQQWNGINAGLIYGTLLIGGIAIGITLVHFFLADDDSLKPVTNYIKIPLSTKLTLAVFSFVTGFLLPVIISPIIKFISGFSITSFAVPLFGGSGTFQSFAVAKIEETMSWKIFNIMFVAGSTETFIYSYIAPVIGILLAVTLISLTSKKGQKNYNRFVVLSISMAFSVLMFILSHIMNNTYTAGAFVIAGLFLLISNLSIYLGGVFLNFWIGYHMSNNLMFLIQQEGFKAVAQGFFSWFGLVFITIWGLMIYFLINNWDEVRKDLKYWFN